MATKVEAVTIAYRHTQVCDNCGAEGFSDVFNSPVGEVVVKHKFVGLKAGWVERDGHVWCSYACMKEDIYGG